jgi:ABC-type transporter MlaC component
MIRIVIILVALASPVAAQPAPQQLGPGSLVVKQANDKVMKLLAAKAPAAQVTSAVRGFLDIRGLGKLAMAAHWSALSPSDQTQFLDMLEKLVEAQYVRAVGAQLNVTVSYLGETKLPSGNILVKTEYATTQNGRPQQVTVDYELAPQGTSWRAIDMVTAGVGLVPNYASMFNAIIQKGGVASLLTKMKAKLAQLPAPTTPAPTTPTNPSTTSSPTVAPTTTPSRP